MTSAIRFEDVAQTYRGIFRHRKVLDGFSLDIREGEIFGLIGPNGAGKTTVMLVALGLLSHEQGHVSVLGSASDDLEVRRRIGYVPENIICYPGYKAHGFLDLCGEMSGLPRADRKRRITELAERLGLSDSLNIAVRKFSRGMLQKLGLIQAALHDPLVYFLDEPTSGMDPVGVKAVRDFVIEQRGRGRTFFLNSHMLTEVERTCDRVAMMSRGKITDEFDIRRKLACVRVSLLSNDGERSAEEMAARLRSTSASGCLGFEADGGGVRITVPDENALARAIAEIVSAGGRVRRVEDSHSNLEAAFFERIAKELEP